MNECASMFCKAHTLSGHTFCGKCEKKKAKAIIDEAIEKNRNQLHKTEALVEAQRGE